MQDAYVEVRSDGRAELVPLVGNALSVGRADSNALAVPGDASVADVHATIERARRGWRVRDHGSSGGTWVNGTRLTSDRALRSGDEIAVGATTVVFRQASGRESTVGSTAESTEPVAAPPAGASALSTGDYLDLGEEWLAPPTSPPIAGRRGRASAANPPARRSTPSRVTPSPARKRGRGKLRGVAHNVQVRKRDRASDVLSFRVDRYDDAGDRLPSIGVEMAGYRQGPIGDGEEVEVSGRWSRGTLRAKKVVNLSTNSELRRGRGGAKLATTVAALVVICFIAFVIYSMVAAHASASPFGS